MKAAHGHGFFWALCIMMLGCSSWDGGTDPTLLAIKKQSPLGNFHSSNNSVTLEIAVVDLDNRALGHFDQVWSQADTQSLSLENRRLLDQNGMRVGLLGSQLPGELLKALSGSKPLLTESGENLYSARDPLPDANQNTFVVRLLKQLTVGESFWLPCSPNLQQMDWNVTRDETNRSGVCTLAQCGFEITLSAEADDQVKIWMRPEIRHGETRLRYGIDQDTLVSQSQKKRLRINELDFFHSVGLGQTLVMSSSAEPVGLGAWFFAANPRPLSRYAILIRPVRIGGDGLFGQSGPTSRRLATSLD